MKVPREAARRGESTARSFLNHGTSTPVEMPKRSCGSRSRRGCGRLQGGATATEQPFEASVVEHQREVQSVRIDARVVARPSHPTLRPLGRLERHTRHASWAEPTLL